MLTSKEALHTRPLGQFPVSISTSLAFEGLMGIHEEHPLPKGQPPPYVNYDSLHINVRTLIRNCFTCMKSEEAYVVVAADMCEIIAEEMQLIGTILAEQIGDRFVHSFYFTSYEKLPKQFPDANLKGANTEKQKYYAALEDETIKRLLTHPSLDSIYYETTDLRTKMGKGRALMLTHYPVDILVAKHKRFSVLESHTGNIRSREMMTNKLKTVKIESIPFDIMTIQFFGDTGDMFRPQSVKYRKVLESIAIKYKWNKTTSESRILSNVKMSGEPHLYDYIRKLYKAPKG